MEDTPSTTIENNQGEVQATGQTSPQEQLTAIKERMVKGEDTAQDKKQFQQLRDHIHFDGPMPDHLRVEPQTDGSAPHDTLGASELYEPAQDVKDFKTPNKIPEGITPDDVSGMKKLALDLGLPQHIGDAFLERVTHHINVNQQESGIAKIDQLDQEGLDVYLEELLRCFGGNQDKAAEAAAKAENYFAQSLPKDQFNRLMEDIGNSTLAFDPVIITKLAALHDARGFKL